MVFQGLLLRSCSIGNLTMSYKETPNCAVGVYTASWDVVEVNPRCTVT